MVDIDNRAWTRLDYAARDINNNGDILANSFVVGPNGTGKIDLKTLGGDFIRTWAINDSRQVVGASTTATGDFRAFITGSEGMGTKNLGTLGGDFSEAYDINDAGQVVGGSYIYERIEHAFITGPNGLGMRDLGTLPGHDQSHAYAINDAGTGNVDLSYTPALLFITGPDGMGDDETSGRCTRSMIKAMPMASITPGQVAGQSSAGRPGIPRLYHRPQWRGHDRSRDPLPAGDVALCLRHQRRRAGGGFIPYVPEHCLDQAFVTGPNGVGTTDLNSLMRSTGRV